MSRRRENSPTARRVAASRSGVDRAEIGGPYSRVIDRGAVGGLIDGRSREGRFLRAYERQLTEHCGGNPSIAQRLLISRAARLALHLELVDEKTLAQGKPLTTHDHNYYVAWSNALTRTLGRLGVEPAAAQPVDPIETLRRHMALRRPLADEDAA